MAISVFKTFINGEVLLASDLNSSLTTIVNEVNTHGSEIDSAAASITVIEAQQAQGQNYGKNLIINGDFSIWQRGTSGFTTLGYSADRWKQIPSGATSTVSRSAFALGQTDVPNNPKYYLTQTVTTGNDFAGVQTRLEGVETTSGKEVTFSFWAKGSNPGGGHFTVALTQLFGTGGSPSASVATNLTDLTVNGTWTKYTATATLPSISGKTLGTNSDDSLEVFIFQPDGDVSTDAWTLDIANVQLEFGDTATEFEYVHPADQLARCQRYFERRYSEASFNPLAPAYYETTTTVHAYLEYTEKRAIPSLSSSVASTFLVVKPGADATPTAITTSADTGRKSAMVILTVPAGTAGQGCILFLTSTAFFDIDAEL